MPTRSVNIARDGQNLHLWYGRRNPATGTYFTNVEITALTFSVTGKDGTVLLAPTAATYVSALRGYVLDWTPSTSLDARNIIYVIATPTTTQARALVGDEVVPVDVSDALQRIDEHEALSVTRQTASLTAIGAIASNLGADDLESIRAKLVRLKNELDVAISAIETNIMAQATTHDAAEAQRFETLSNTVVINGPIAETPSGRPLRAV